MRVFKYFIKIKKIKFNKIIFLNSVLVLLLIFSFIIGPSKVYALDTGAISPGTVSYDNSVGTLYWSYPDGAKTSNDIYSDSSSMSSDETTYYLKATNFGFSIPIGASINGILVEVEKHYETLGSGIVKDSEVKIVKSDGTIGTVNRADTVNDWPVSDTYISYGSAYDNWGEVWTATDINDADFGVVLSANLLNDYPLAYVDHIRITVYYTVGFSCSVTTASSCSGVVLLRMSDSLPTGPTNLDSTPGYNAHAELPSQSTNTYDDFVVCCNGIVGLGNSCSGNYQIIGKLSDVTNAHFQENTYGTYMNNFCLSSTTPGDEIIIGYQDSSCSGYGTTLFSVSSSDNATLGDASSYPRKVCGSVIPLQISFSVSDNLIGFGNLTSSTSRYATGDELGSGTEVEAHTISASTNADSGYVITVDGSTLTSASNTINPIGGMNSSPSPGNEQFGLRATIVSGTGNVSSPYSNSGFALDSSNFPDEIATGDGDDSMTIYSLRYLGNISQYTEAGNYSANLTYIMTGTF